MDSDFLRAGHIPRAQHRAWQEVVAQSVRSNNAQLASSALRQKGGHPPTSCLVVCMTHQVPTERVIQGLPGSGPATWLGIQGPPASLAILLIHTAPSFSNSFYLTPFLFFLISKILQLCSMLLPQTPMGAPIGSVLRALLELVLPYKSRHRTWEFQGGY